MTHHPDDKRYFYTDPLAAAFMAKHFGMKFGILHNEKLIWDCIGRIDGPWGPLTDPDDILDPISRHDALYIHPDSLAILEPEVGDLALCEIDDMNHREAEFQMVTYEPELFDARHGVCRILFRDGKPFHWPEREP